MLERIAQKLVPESVKEKVREYRRKQTQARVSELPALSRKEFENILRHDCALGTGDVVFVHSSVDQLNLDFPFFQILGILRDIIGSEGTMLFPTYPRLSSYRHLQSDPTFDVRKSPSYTGILSEFARRQRSALRSLHPTKSVCAIGPQAEYLTSSHQDSPYPYDKPSPYYRTVELQGKVIGVGVGTFNLSLVHCVDDLHREAFPVEPYHSRIFEVDCVDVDGHHRRVSTYAHDMRKMDFDIPAFMKEYVPQKIARDFTVSGQRFFTADASELYSTMSRLAVDEQATIYRRKHYRKVES